jgi:glyoxylase-like metal-dependent hydrolase (beta-lactamase superfamily II)
VAVGGARDGRGDGQRPRAEATELGRTGGPEPAGADEESSPPPILDHGDAIHAIDTLTAGMTSVTAGYLIAAPRPALIECGPARSIGNVLRGLRSLGMDGDDLAYVVLTHIHLDHAGGAGDVAAAFPNATIAVSEIGASHLHDPGRLNRSAAKVYGPLYDPVYGPCTPIAAQRLLGVADGDVLELGGGRSLEIIDTPGHAKHHVGVLDTGTGAIFSGDSVGVKLPGMTVLRPATPPADFHLEAALASLERYRRREPSRVYLAHYGPVDPPDEALAEADERLRLWAATAEAAYHVASELDHVAETLRRRFTDELTVGASASDPDATRRIELLSDVRSNAAGLLRYFERRDAGTLTTRG